MLTGVGELGVTEWLMHGITGMVVVVCAAVVARAIFVPSDVKRGCCCGGCGYAIADIGPGRCPECGGKLTKVGLSTPAMAVRMRGGLGWALLAWTVLCGVIAQLAWGYVEQSAWSAAAVITSMASGPGGKMQSTHENTYEPQRFGGMRGQSEEPSVLDYRIDATDSYVSNAGTVESGTATLTLHRNGTTEKATMELDLGDKTFVLKDGKGAELKKGSAAAVDDALIGAWFEAAALKPQTAPEKLAASDAKRLVGGYFDDAEGLQSMFSGIPSAQMGSLSSRGGGSSSGPVGGGYRGGMPGPPDFWGMRTRVIAGVLGSFYLAGVVFIWRKRRGLLA